MPESTIEWLGRKRAKLAQERGDIINNPIDGWDPDAVKEQSDRKAKLTREITTIDKALERQFRMCGSDLAAQQREKSGLTKR